MINELFTIMLNSVQLFKKNKSPRVFRAVFKVNFIELGNNIVYIWHLNKQSRSRHLLCSTGLLQKNNRDFNSKILQCKTVKML